MLIRSANVIALELVHAEDKHRQRVRNDINAHPEAEAKSCKNLNIGVQRIRPFERAEKHFNCKCCMQLPVQLLYALVQRRKGWHAKYREDAPKRYTVRTVGLCGSAAIASATANVAIQAGAHLRSLKRRAGFRCVQHKHACDLGDAERCPCSCSVHSKEQRRRPLCSRSRLLTELRRNPAPQLKAGACGFFNCSVVFGMQTPLTAAA